MIVSDLLGEPILKESYVFVWPQIVEYNAVSSHLIAAVNMRGLSPFQIVYKI